MSVTLHTDAGDIKVEIFCEAAPKAAEVSETAFSHCNGVLTQNFMALCASGTYDETKIHRNIKSESEHSAVPAAT